MNREDEQTLQVIEAPLHKGSFSEIKELEVLGFRNLKRFNPLNNYKKDFVKFLNFEIREKSVCELYLGKLFHLDTNQICTKRSKIHNSAPVKVSIDIKLKLTNIYS